MLIDIDKNKPIQKIKLSIAKPNKEVIGILKEAYNINLKLDLGNISELSFTLPLKLEIKHKLTNNPHINLIKYKYLIKLEYGNFVEWYQIENPQPTMNEDSDEFQVDCMSLPIEMKNKIIKQYKEESKNAVQILTDVLTGLYEVNDISNCLWSFDYIGPEFNAMFRTFEVSQKTLLDFLLTDITETFDAVIIFNTLNRTFSLYKKENIGINKGLKIDYGRLLKTLNKSLNTENFCTRLKCYGKDGLTITEINPMGKHYLEDFSYFLDEYEEDELGNVISSSSYLTDSLCKSIINHKILIATKDKELDVAEIGTTMFSIKMTDHGLITGDYILNRDKGNEIRRITKVDNDNITLDLKETSIKYALDGTTETNIHIIGHKLNTGDYIVNKSKLDARRQITKVDDDNFTVDSILGQMIDDEISLEKYSITDQASGDKIYKYKNGTFGKLLYQKRDLQKELDLLKNKLNNVLTPQLYEKLDSIAVLEEIGISPGSLIGERDAIQVDINAQLLLISVKEMEIANKDIEIDNLRTLLSMESNFTEPQILELNQFIIEEVWEDSKYIDMFDLYEEGLKRFADINSPKDNIELNIVNLLEVVECQHDWNKLVLGDQVRLKNELLNIDVLFNIIEINFNFESGDIDLVIGDIKNTFSDEDKVIDKLNKAIDTTNDLNNKKINWDNIATNFDNRNDRITTLPANPVVINDALNADDAAITSTINTDGSANIKFKWSFDGLGEAYDVDGFIIYVRSTTSTESYIFGSTIAQEQAYSLQTNKRTFELYGVPANKYYTFGIQAYRKVDIDIESSGYLKSSVVKVTSGANQNPHRPSSTVNFDGNVSGKIDGKPVSDITGFIDITYPGKILDIQNQIDGKIDSYFQEADPNTWIAADRPKHDGDMWYKASTKELKRYNGTSNTWELIEDKKAIDAYALAGTAKDTADGKRRVFVVQPTTSDAYDIGDLWTGGSTGDLKKCKTAKLAGQTYSVSHWELATKYTDDTNANLAIGQISDMSSDGKITPVEKLPLKQEWDIIVAEKPNIESQATTFGITTEKTNYTTAYDALNTYLNTTLKLFLDMAATTSIVRTTFDTNWKSYYDKRQILLNKMSEVAKSAGDNALQPNTSYNSVKITTTNGIQVFDNQATPQERVKVGNIGTDLYGIQLKDKSGNTNFSVDSDGKIDIKHKDGLFQGTTLEMMYYAMMFGE